MTVLPDNVLRCLPPDIRKGLGKAGVTAEEAEAIIAAKGEKFLQSTISNYLRLHGVPFLWNRMDRKHTGVVGTPDFVCFVNGKLLLWEVKTPTGKVSPEQIKFHDELKKQGFEVSIIRTFEEAANQLKKAQENE